MTKHSDPYRVLFGATIVGLTLALASMSSALGAFAGERDDLQAPRVSRADSTARLGTLRQALGGPDVPAPQGQDVRASPADVGRGEWRGRTVIRGHAE